MTQRSRNDIGKYALPDGLPLDIAGWETDGDTLGMLLHRAGSGRLAVLFNRGTAPVRFDLPGGNSVDVAPRSVRFVAHLMT